MRTASVTLPPASRWRPPGHLATSITRQWRRRQRPQVHAALRLTGCIEPIDRLWLQIDYHSFWRANDADALYDAGGSVVFAGASGSSRYVGSEIDFTVGFAFDHHTALLIGYSRIFRGRFVMENRGRDINLWYTQLTFTF